MLSGNTGNPPADAVFARECLLGKWNNELKQHRKRIFCELKIKEKVVNEFKNIFIFRDYSFGARFEKFDGLSISNAR
jgi:hypothetical protein